MVILGTRVEGINFQFVTQEPGRFLKPKDSGWDKIGWDGIGWRKTLPGGKKN
jgi:hypothetical protein